jgi:hypothetical protein
MDIGAATLRAAQKYKPMAKQAMPNYLRRERRSWGLTQPELAELVGYRCDTQVSRVERESRSCTLHVLIAYRVIFGLMPEHICPHLYQEVEAQVVRRAYVLYQRLEADLSPNAVKKKELLTRVLRRAVTLK